MSRAGRLRVVVACLAAAVVASGCGRSEDADAGSTLAGTRITFSIAVSRDEAPAIRELLSRFQSRTKATVDLERLTRFRRQPGARVNLVTTITSDELADALRAPGHGRPPIHLFAQDNLALKELVDEGLVDDLSAVAIPGEVLPSMVPPMFGGRQLFLPFRPNVRVAYLDARAAERAGVRPPTTVEDFERAAQLLHDATGRPAVTLSLAEGDPAAVTVAELVLSFGGNPLVLNDAGSVQAFQFLQRLWQRGLLARESLFARYDTEVDYLRTGRTALAQNWSFTSSVLARREALGRFRVYPGWSGPGGAVHVIGGDVLGIPKGIDKEQRRVAVALAQFLMSREAQEHLVRANAWPSIRGDAYRRVPAEQVETFAAIQRALRDGWFRPSVSYWPDVSAAMNEAVDRVLLRQHPVGPVLDELHDRIAAAARDKGEAYPPPAP